MRWAEEPILARIRPQTARFYGSGESECNQEVPPGPSRGGSPGANTIGKLCVGRVCNPSAFTGTGCKPVLHTFLLVGVVGRVCNPSGFTGRVANPSYSCTPRP